MAEKLKEILKTSGSYYKANTITPAKDDILLFETGLSTQNVIKDLFLEGEVNYPAVSLYLKVNGYRVSEVGEVAGSYKISLSGSQIVGTNSSVSLGLEAPDKLYPEYQVVDEDPVTKNLRYRRGDGFSVVSSIPAFDFYTGFTVSRNGELVFCLSTGSHLKCYTFNEATRDLVYIAQVTWPSTTLFACADTDNTYIYGKDSVSNNILRRIDIASLSPTTDLALSSNVGYMSGSNAGFIDYYGGHVYMRDTGSSDIIHKIRVSDGNVSSISAPTATSEHIGGLITVNTSGVPVLIEHQDMNIGILNLDTLEYNTVASIMKDPTTTYAATCYNAGNGVVRFVTPSYYDKVSVDVNDSILYPKQSLLFFDQSVDTSRGYASLPFKSPDPLPLDMTYKIHISGVEITEVV